jgi:hypothetical protein
MAKQVFLVSDLHFGHSKMYDFFPCGKECEAELRRNRRLAGAASTLLLSSWGLHSHFESQTDPLV